MEHGVINIRFELNEDGSVLATTTVLRPGREKDETVRNYGTLADAGVTVLGAFFQGLYPEIKGLKLRFKRKSKTEAQS